MKAPARFDSRLQYSLQMLGDSIARARSPVALSSFGKDSLCLLAALDEAGAKIEIAYFELGAISSVHRFAWDFIVANRLSVRWIEPHSTLLLEGQYGADIAYEFRLGSGDSIQIAGATFDDTDSVDLRCGLDLRLSKGGLHPPYEWDLILSGRRNVDKDPTLGPLGAQPVSVTLEHGTTVLMPLAEWSDEDVAYYLGAKDRFRPDMERYEFRAGSLRSRRTSANNPDHLPICIRCIAAAAAVPVCPLSSSRVSNAHALRERIVIPCGAIPATVML